MEVMWAMKRHIASGEQVGLVIDVQTVWIDGYEFRSMCPGASGLAIKWDAA